MVKKTKTIDKFDGTIKALNGKRYFLNWYEQDDGETCKQFIMITECSRLTKKQLQKLEDNDEDTTEMLECYDFEEYQG